MKKCFELMFDKTGGLIMSLMHGDERVYVHAYDDMEQAAGDLREFFSLEYSVTLWDGNLLEDDDFDSDSLEFSAGVERFGELFWAWEIEQIRRSIQIHSWKNVQDFITAWERLMME